MTLLVGLTGGIGSGKTTVAEMFRARGAAIVDTDEISRALTGAGGEALPLIVREFGAEFMHEGALHRDRMRERVFRDADALARLEAITHPLIRRDVEAAVARVRGYALLVVPLLFEKMTYRTTVARTLAVDCPEALQLERVARRSNLPRDAVAAIMRAQVPRRVRLQLADDVICNAAEPAALAVQVDRLHVSYLEPPPGPPCGEKIVKTVAFGQNSPNPPLELP